MSFSSFVFAKPKMLLFEQITVTKQRSQVCFVFSAPSFESQFISWMQKILGQLISLKSLLLHSGNFSQKLGIFDPKMNLYQKSTQLVFVQKTFHCAFLQGLSLWIDSFWVTGKNLLAGKIPFQRLLFLSLSVGLFLEVMVLWSWPHFFLVLYIRIEARLKSLVTCIESKTLLKASESLLAIVGAFVRMGD